MLNERLRRVTDLFIEGTELYFGTDENQQPIVIWVNKLNSFEVEEARRDAMVRRGIRIGELTKADSPELAGIKATIDGWDDGRLAERRVNQMVEEIYLEVLNDIETDAEWRDKVALVRRGPTLLDDESLPADDPRRVAVAEAQDQYLDRIRELQQLKTEERIAELKDNSRTGNIEDYLENWRNRESLDVFMAERRVSELYAALRDCKAGVVFGEDGEQQTMRFDHAGCDHSVRLCSERKEVYNLPETVVLRAGDAIDGITAPGREAGNSDAPTSSSASSEPSSEAEEASIPSIPEETPLAAATT